VPAAEFILSGAANENPLFGVDSIPFLATGYADAKRLYQAAKPAQDKLLASQGMKVLFTVPWPGQSLYSLKPIKRRRILRVPRCAPTTRPPPALRSCSRPQPVTIQLAELGQALATGGVQNFLTSSASGVESKLHEQTKYFYPVSAWLPRNATVVSQKALTRWTSPRRRRCSRPPPQPKRAAGPPANGWTVNTSRSSAPRA
jgi:TRAP-type C4-dicarboxylate transport system substrate-binding protein